MSGSGKSTLIKLLLRLYDISHGRILINGKSISTFSTSHLRNSIVLTPQETSLFNRTIFENIRYGKKDASYEEVIKVATEAGCHNFIMKLSNKYETIIGNNGTLLSGGQKQLIMIARSLLKQAEIFIFDESIASIDHVTSRNVLNILDKHTKNQTTIIITHQLSSITNVDNIIVMQNGEVYETGTHVELLKNRSLYYELWREEFAKQRN